MLIELDRFKSNKLTTLGKLNVGGNFACYVLEDAFQSVKVHGKTRIPQGRYQIVLRKLGTSRFDESYSKKFSFHKGMLQLANVPGFEGVLIHIGNFAKDTDGCLLVGSSIVVPSEPDKAMMVQDSKHAYEKLYPRLLAILEKEPLFIQIKDNDRTELMS